MMNICLFTADAAVGGSEGRMDGVRLGELNIGSRGHLIRIGLRIQRNVSDCNRIPARSLLERASENKPNFITTVSLDM